MRQRPAKLFQAGVLLTLYNANRHRRGRLQSLPILSRFAVHEHSGVIPRLAPRLVL